MSAEGYAYRRNYEVGLRDIRRIQKGEGRPRGRRNPLSVASLARDFGPNVCYCY